MTRVALKVSARERFRGAIIKTDRNRIAVFNRDFFKELCPYQLSEACPQDHIRKCSHR